LAQMAAWYRAYDRNDEDLLDRHSEAYYKRLTRIEDEDTTILRHLPATDREMGRLLSDPTLRQWHEHARNLLSDYLASQHDPAQGSAA
jgi:hypothetical protein